VATRRVGSCRQANDDFITQEKMAWFHTSSSKSESLDNVTLASKCNLLFSSYRHLKYFTIHR
jgi:hypothetical protein